MTTPSLTSITVETKVNAPLTKVWEHWTAPQHITQWNAASDEWHTPRAVNDLREGGQFNWRMEAKDGSMGFDFTGTYTLVQAPTQLNYTMEDGRKVAITFTNMDAATHVTETFEAESTHPAEMQRAGWQAILDNFKKYVEGLD